MNTPNFVGRKSDLIQIEEQLLDVMTERTRVLLVEGIAGMGKSRLIEEIEARAKLHDMKTAVGRCYEDMAYPYAPFRSLLMYFEEEELLDDSGSSFLHLLTGREVLSSDVLTAGNTKPEKRLFMNVTQAVITLASRRPLVFIVEDLHWADPSTLDLFDYLIFALAQESSIRLFLIGTYRPVEPESRLGNLLRRLRAEDVARWLELSGLDEMETRSFLEEMGVRRPTQQLVQIVYETTQGVPLFIQEAVDYLTRSGSLEEQDGYLTTTPSALESIQMPQTLSDAIESRVQSLPALHLNILSLIALIDYRVEPDQLLALEIASESELSTAIQVGVAYGILVDDDSQLRFGHPLVQRAISARLLLEERQQFHFQIALSLQNLYSDELDSHIFEITNHLIEARGLVDSHTALSWFRRAAEQAFSMLAWSDSVRYYERVVELLDSALDISAQYRAEIYYRLGLAHYRNQDRGPALAYFDQSEQAYRELDDIQGLAQAVIWQSLLRFLQDALPVGEMPDIDHIEDILDTLGDSNPELSGELVVILSQVYRQARQSQIADSLARQAINLGHLANNDRICAAAYNALGLAYINSLQVQDAVQNWQESAVYASRTDDLRQYSLALLNLPLGLNLRGELQEAESQALKGCEVARSIQDWGGYSKGLSHLASIAISKGEFRAAERYADQTLPMVERSRYQWGGFRAMQAGSCAMAMRGLWEAAENYLDILIEPGRIFPSPGHFEQVLVRVFRQLIRSYRQMDFDENIPALAEELMTVVMSDTYSLTPLCAMIELGERVFEPNIVEYPAQMVSEFAKRGVYFSSGWVFLLPRLLGTVAVLNEEWQQAELYFQQAERISIESGSPTQLGLTYYSYARMIMLKWEGATNYSEASEMIEKAISLLHEYDMIPYAQEAIKLRDVINNHLK